MKTWKTISVFVSSTFKDMNAERDYLMKYVLPRLNEALNPKRIFVRFIELRWGVNTMDIMEEERESMVLNVCLDSIRNNRPFFIGLLGDRYGWIAPKQKWDNIYHSLTKKEQQILESGSEKSVTELEILFGALGDKNNLLSRSLFYFRSPHSYNGMTVEQKREYQESNDTSIKKLKHLKNEIKQVCKKRGYHNAVREYTLSWITSPKDSQKAIFDIHEDWGTMIYNDLMREINEEFDLTSDEYLESWEKQELYYLENFIESRHSNFYGRIDLLKRYENFLTNYPDITNLINAEKGYLLTGFSGCGKSAIFAKLYKYVQRKIEEKQPFFLLAHAAGITPVSSSLTMMFKRWIFEIKCFLGEEKDNDFENIETLECELRRQVARLQLRGYKVIMLIDSLNNFELEDSDLINDFRFVPPMVPFVCTTIEYEEKVLNTNLRIKSEIVDAFSIEEARNMIRGMNLLHYKTLPDGVETALLKVRDGENWAYASPLWLNIALNVFFSLDADDFYEIRDRNEQNYITETERFMINLAKSFPAKPEDLFMDLIERIAKDFGQKFTYDTLTYIAISENGLPETDLSALLGNDWDTLRFANLRRWFGQYINDKNTLSAWRFTHNCLRTALLTQDPEYILNLRRNLLEYLYLNDNYFYDNPDDYHVTEYVYQLVYSNNYDRLYCFIEENKSPVYSRKIVSNILFKDKVASKNFLKHYHENTYNQRHGLRLLWILAHELFTKRSRWEWYSNEPQFAVQLLKDFLNNFNKDELLSENTAITRNYLEIFEMYADFEGKITNHTELDNAFEWIIDIFDTAKNNKRVFDYELVLPIYRRYIEKLYKSGKHQKAAFFRDKLFELSVFVLQQNPEDTVPFTDFDFSSIASEIEQCYYIIKIHNVLYDNHFLVNSPQLAKRKRIIIESFISIYLSLTDITYLNESKLTVYLANHNYELESLESNKFKELSDKFKELKEYHQRKYVGDSIGKIKYSDTVLDVYKKLFIKKNEKLDEIKMDLRHITYPRLENIKDTFFYEYEPEYKLILQKRGIGLSLKKWITKEWIINKLIQIRGGEFHIDFSLKKWIAAKKNILAEFDKYLLNFSFKRPEFSKDIPVYDFSVLRNLSSLCSNYRKNSTHLNALKVSYNISVFLLWNNISYRLRGYDMECIIKIINSLSDYYAYNEQNKEVMQLNESFYMFLRRFILHGTIEDCDFSFLVYLYKKMNKKKELNIFIKNYSLLRYRYYLERYTANGFFEGEDGGFSEGLARIKIKNFWGFINEKKEVVIEPRYRAVGDFHEGYAWACLGTEKRNRSDFIGLKYGFIDKTGQTVVPFIYDDAWSFLNGEALVMCKGDLYTINIKGEFLNNKA